jgi:hypothetical protein
MVAPNEYEQILKTVEQWPLEDRLRLAKALAAPPATSRRPSFSRAYGIARPDRPPPTDEEVKQWIHEHRMRKYGS